ncbi:MHC class I polypeptide-related sequence B-like isoform X2 [Odocoileus virginianus]|uniref:MHC class I polypeptide-related sequence B-like isoform X2 n=1 Tax=Odocoileus virginianus TaxID=9874 RepID=A0ABM4HBG6_ODOVR
MIWAMGLSLVWPFLAGAAFFVLLGTAAGSHSLSYNTTVLSWDGFVQSRFFAEGHLDGQAFLHFDDTKWRAEPQGWWAERLGAETWETESKDLNETCKELRTLLAEILSLQEEKRGLHSLQETVGCEIREDSRARGFRLLHFDGELLLSCYPEAHGCALPQSLARTLAMEMEKSWDTDGFLSKHYQAHVQGELCGRLRVYLESWTGFMERTVPPAVNVTRSQDSEGMVHLTCRAFGFFPRNISVAWFWDEEPMSRDALESGGILPDGNGTYYTWETIIIPQGEEQRVKCLVEHSGNHSTHLAPLGPASKVQFQHPPLVSCSSLQVESESDHLQAPSNLESLCELPEDVSFIPSPGMAGTSQQVFCAVDSEFLPDQDAAQSSLRLLSHAQSLTCGTESINI